MAEKIRLRIGDLAKAVLITGQAYQDPKDALNEFVSNAADEYVETGRRGERIRIILRRKGKRPVVAVEDAGRGMSAERLREVARNLFRSTKADDPRTIGEKAIGILSFQQLGGRCSIYSRADGSPDTWVLHLARGSPRASLQKAEAHRRRSTPGTTAYLHDLDPDVLRVLTRRKIVDYLRRRRGPALARGEYSIEVQEGRSAELVTAEEPDGIHLDIPAGNTLWGRIEFALYVAPRPDRRRRVAVVGRGGTTVIDDIAELDEFSEEPWTADQVSGMVAFDALQQTAGRRAILRDREAFPVFVDAVRSVEPAVRRVIERVTKEVDEETADRLAEIVRRIFGKVLRELEDVDNPMRTLVGQGEGEGALFEEEPTPGEPREPPGPADLEPPSLQETVPPAVDPEPAALQAPPQAGAERGRSRSLPTVAPDPNPDSVRSRYDPEGRIVYYNDQHADYLIVKDDEQSLLEYLSTLVAKELVVYNNPRAQPGELGEELVRMLVRVRRHIPRRR
ncbi:MAG: sensor histidine kinase [Acidobacteria bacterium]|nr:sensor histidine kinase [Acidobacteriota bacterium]